MENSEATEYGGDKNVVVHTPVCKNLATKRTAGSAS